MKRVVLDKTYVRLRVALAHSLIDELRLRLTVSHSRCKGMRPVARDCLEQPVGPETGVQWSPRIAQCLLTVGLIDQDSGHQGILEGR